MTTPAHWLKRARLFIDAQHGLGNRLRAIASAAGIAEATERELVVVWQPDHHCEARFLDLFRYGNAVIETAFPQVFARAGGRVYNYMEIEPGAAKDAAILAEEPEGCGRAGQGDIYVRSAYELVSPHRRPGTESAFLRGLQPTAEVIALVRSVRCPNQVAAHVRMASGPAYEHLPWEAPSNWPARGHAEIAAWRARSHARYFIERLDALVAAGKADTIYLAADLPETYACLAERYGRRMAWLPRDHFDRSARQVQYALADALLLSNAERFLGSSWSSFSHLARRLSDRISRVEFSGIDF